MHITTPARHVFDILEEASTEDGGQSVQLEYHGESEGLFVRVMSWDEGRPPQHEDMAPFKADPDNVRVILEQVFLPVEGAPEALSDEMLGRARDQAVEAIAEAARAQAQASDPRRDLPEVAASLASAELGDLHDRLALIDAEILHRMAP